MKKCDLELLQWYNIDYKDRTPSRKYSGPGLYVGYCEYEKAYQFYIPCNLHVLRGDQARYMKKRVFPGVRRARDPLPHAKCHLLARRGSGPFVSGRGSPLQY